MIEEDYCSSEVAKLLEEKRFIKNCGRIHAVCNGFTVDAIVTPDAPTHQTAMKWLREKHIIIVIFPKYFHVDGTCSVYKYQIWADDNFEKEEECLKYEDAVETALKYSLENLI